MGNHARRNFTTEKQIEIADYSVQYTIVSAALKYEISESTIKAYRKKHGKMANAGYSEEYKKAAVDILNNKGIAAVWAAYPHLSQNVVYNWRRERRAGKVEDNKFFFTSKAAISPAIMSLAVNV